MNQEEFEKLRAKWYKKLARKGFKDIETFGGTLINWQTKQWRPWTKDGTIYARAGEAYYEACKDFYNIYKGWESPQHKIMWKLYADGASLSSIGRKYGLAWHKVFTIFKRYRDLLTNYTKFMKVVLRNKKAEDENFIYSSYLKDKYYKDKALTTLSKDVWMNAQHARLEKILANPESVIHIACLSDDPDTILGYCLFSGGERYSYIKKDWRGIGIEKLFKE